MLSYLTPGQIAANNAEAERITGKKLVGSVHHGAIDPGPKVIGRTVASDEFSRRLAARKAG